MKGNGTNLQKEVLKSVVKNLESSGMAILAHNFQFSRKIWACKYIFMILWKNLRWVILRKCQTLQELLGICDVITLHVDGAKTNKNLIGVKEFEQMKDGVIFLNLSRGTCC